MAAVTPVLLDQPKSIDKNKLMGRRILPPAQTVKPKALLPAASEEGGEKNQTINTNNLADRLNNIVAALGVLFTLKKQEFKVDKKVAAQDLKNQSDEQKAAREQQLERKKKKKEASKPQVLPKPFTGFFDTIKTFFGNILAGSIVLKMLKWLNDPQNAEKIDKFTGFLRKNALAIVGIIAFFAALPLISTIVSLTNMLLMGIGLMIKPLVWLFGAAGLWKLAIAAGITAAVFGFAKRQITGGGEFSKFDTALRDITEQEGLDFKNAKTGALVLDDEGNPIRVKTWEGDTGAAGDDKWGSFMGRPFNAAAGDQGKNTSAAINLKNELHREWIKNNLGEAKLAQLDAAYDRYVALMGEKDTLKKQMGDEIRSSNKAVEKKFEKEISAARFWKPVKSWQLNQQILKEKKLRENEIRAQYDARVRKKFAPTFEKSGSSTNDFGFGNIQNQINDLKTQEVNLQKKVPSRQISQPLGGGEGEINFLDLSTSGDSGESGAGTESGNQGASFSSNRGRVGNRVILGVLN